jgi:hypothetical protein
MGGYVTDPSGATVGNARVTITSLDNGGTRTVATDGQGHWVVAGMTSGNFKAKVEMDGFKTSLFDLSYDANQPSMYSFPLNVASASESVEVSAQALQIQADSSAIHGNLYDVPMNGRNSARLHAGLSNPAGASANVINLQKRVAGVLPVAITVPRTGTSFAFVRPLVLDEETKVTFSYKSR